MTNSRSELAGELAKVRPGGPAVQFVICLFSAQPVRYLFVGGLLFLFGLGIFLFFYAVCGLDLRIAEGISRAAGALVGFFGHKYFTFRTRDDREEMLSIPTQGGAYLLVTVANIFIAPWVLYATVILSGLHIVIDKVIAEMVMVVETYILLKLIFIRRCQHDS